jgi:hypothetical protein
MKKTKTLVFSLKKLVERKPYTTAALAALVIISFRERTQNVSTLMNDELEKKSSNNGNCM